MKSLLVFGFADLVDSDYYSFSIITNIPNYCLNDHQAVCDTDNMRYKVIHNTKEIIQYYILNE